MAAINPVATWQAQDFQTQGGTTYKTAIDNNVFVGKRITDAFAPHAEATPSMKVVIDAGYVFVNQALTEVAQQTTTTITAPASNPRIDRIVYDRVTGVYSIVTGTEAASPVAPAIPQGKNPICQVLLDNSPVTTTITNAIIYDERLGSGAPAGLTLIERKILTANATTSTFSGLDGNTDGAYFLRAHIKNNAGADATYTMRPNGLTTNQGHVVLQTDGTNITTAIGSTLPIGVVQAAAFCDSYTEFNAKANPNSQAYARGGMSRSGGLFTAIDYIILHHLRWNETSTNITSIDIVSNQTNGLGNGSELELYRVN